MSRATGRRDVPPQPTSFCSPPPDEHAPITGVRFRLADLTGNVHCDLLLGGQPEPVFAFSYARGTLSFGDELIGMSFGEARTLFRDRDIAYVQRLLGPTGRTD